MHFFQVVLDYNIIYLYKVHQIGGVARRASEFQLSVHSVGHPYYDCRPIILRDKITRKIVYDLELYNYTFVASCAHKR